MAQYLISFLDPVLAAYQEKVLQNPSPHEHARAAPDAGREMEVGGWVGLWFCGQAAGHRMGGEGGMRG